MSAIVPSAIVLSVIMVNDILVSVIDTVLQPAS